MSFIIQIRDIGGNLFGEYDYDQLDNRDIQELKIEEVLDNIYVKNNCLESNKIIILMNEDEHYYINFIYLKNDKLHFSHYKILNNDLINTNQLKIVFRDISISIDNFKNITLLDNQLNFQLLYHQLYHQLFEYLEEYYLAYFFVNMNTYLLFFVSPNIINYKKIVLSAIKRNPYSLEFARHLQDDKEVVLKAIKYNGNVLQYASSKLQSDIEIVLEADKSNRLAIRHASNELRDDKEVIY